MLYEPSSRPCDEGHMLYGYNDYFYMRSELYCIGFFYIVPD